MRTQRRFPLRRTFLPTTVTAVLVGTALTACSNDEDAGPVDAPVSGVSVTLNDNGGSPREPLVWFSDSTETESVYRATQGLEQQTRGGAEQDDLPYEEVTMEVPLTVSTSTDGDDLEALVVAGSPTGDNLELNEDISSAEGFTMTQNYGQDGRVSSRGFSAPEESTESARVSVEQSFNQMVDIPIVFPEEEVGSGAQWTVTGQVDDNVSMRQAVTYTLVSREDSRIDLDVSVERTPSVRQLPGTDLQVTDSTSDSDGAITVDLRRPVPVSGMVETTTEVTYGEAGSDVSVIQTSRTRSTWEPA